MVYTQENTTMTIIIHLAELQHCRV